MIDKVEEQEKEIEKIKKEIEKCSVQDVEKN